MRIVNSIGHIKLGKEVSPLACRIHLREQRDVARLEHEERALEADLDVRGGAGEPRIAALSRIVFDEELEITATEV